MFVEHLILKNFRNYENLNIDFSKNVNIIYGDNGQGKTNIVEAIFICATGRSHRTSKDAELIKIGSQRSYVGLYSQNSKINQKIEIQLDRSEKKKVKLNDIPAKKMGELMGRLNAVIFCPEDLLIVKEGPSERRRFIDIALSQLKPAYFYELQQYSKVLMQKNVLLKNIYKNKSLKDTLEVWNLNLAEKGARITKMRHDFLSRVSRHAAQQHFLITGGIENLDLRYKPSIKSNLEDSITTIKEIFLKQLEDAVPREIDKGISLVGPQRDDFELTLNGIDLKNFGSQGQQRTAVLALKISEINIIKEEIDENPILLLDDVMSELDIKRQEFLFDALGNIQTFITCTDKNIFSKKTSLTGVFYEVNNGKILL